MMSFMGCADVLTVTNYSAAPFNRSASNIPLDAQDASSNLRNLHGLFAAPTEHGGIAQRAQKRRKVESNTATSVSSDALRQESSILLAKITLELVGGHPITPRWLD